MYILWVSVIGLSQVYIIVYIDGIICKLYWLEYMDRARGFIDVNSSLYSIINEMQHKSLIIGIHSTEILFYYCRRYMFSLIKEKYNFFLFKMKIQWKYYIEFNSITIQQKPLFVENSLQYMVNVYLLIKNEGFLILPTENHNKFILYTM